LLQSFGFVVNLIEVIGDLATFVEVFMAKMADDVLSRDELALLQFYRGLPFDKQFKLLEEAEHDFNDARRMEMLSVRPSAEGSDRLGWS